MQASNNSTSESITYISSRQDALVGIGLLDNEEDFNLTKKNFNQTRKIFIDGDSFKIELPDDTILSGTLIPKKSYKVSEEKSFTTNQECPLLIKPGVIFVNLFKTHNAAYTFYLDSERVTYISNKQVVITGIPDEEIEFNQTRKIFVYGDSFIVELPDDTILSGTLVPNENYKESEDEYFTTDQECPFVIKPWEIFINLFKTHEIAYIYYLD
jgi:hypothetical protein